MSLMSLLTIFEYSFMCVFKYTINFEWPLRIAFRKNSFFNCLVLFCFVIFSFLIVSLIEIHTLADVINKNIITQCPTNNPAYISRCLFCEYPSSHWRKIWTRIYKFTGSRRKMVYACTDLTNTVFSKRFQLQLYVSLKNTIDTCLIHSGIESTMI